MKPYRRTRRSKTPEGILVGQCLDWLTMKGIFVWRNNTQGVFDPVKKIFRRFEGLKGVSDLVGVLPGGRFLAVELKVKPNKLSPEQKYFLDQVNENGGLGIVAYDLNDLIQAVEEKGK